MGCDSDGRADGATSTTSNSSTSPISSRTDATASASVRSGANLWFTMIVAESGTTLDATPPATSTTWRPSRYTQPSTSTCRPS